MNFKAEYQAALSSGFRPVLLLVCTRDQGGIVSREVKNSKDAQKVGESLLSEMELTDYLVWVDSNRRYSDVIFEAE